MKYLLQVCVWRWEQWRNSFIPSTLLAPETIPPNKELAQRIVATLFVGKRSPIDFAGEMIILVFVVAVAMWLMITVAQVEIFDLILAPILDS